MAAPNISEMRNKFINNQKAAIDNDAIKHQQAASDAVNRRFTALGQSGSGAAIAAQQQIHNDVAANKQKAMADLGNQEMQSTMAEAQMAHQSGESAAARAFQGGLADKDMGLKREFFGKEQGNKDREFGLAERQFALDKETTEFNRMLASQEAGKESPGLLGGGGMLGTGIGGKKGFLGTGILSGGGK